MKFNSPFSIATLAKFYGVSTDYLMGLTETKNHPNTDLHDLHLSDEMIGLLKCGKINKRLLCDILTIPYDTLKPNEFAGLIAALEKSEILKIAKNLRGKYGHYQKHGKGKRKRK